MKKPTFIQTMNYVLAKPAQVLGITNINTFKSFISGFCYGRGRDDELPFMEEFHKWAVNRYTTSKDDYERGRGWVALFLFLARKTTIEQRELASKYLQNNFDEEAIALYIMADAWEEFMKDCPIEKYPYEPEVAKKIRKYRSIDEAVS